MQKIINKHKFEKSNKLKNPKHTNLSDVFDNSIILDINETGTSSCPEDSLIFLLLDDNDLESSGWKRYKDKFIADGTITQADIDAEKIKPEVTARLQELKDKIDSSLIS